MSTLQEADERREMDAHDLWLWLGRFISDNESHRILERRWLAMMASQLAKIALGLKTGGVTTLSEHHQQAILDFRLGEIQIEQNRLDKANEKLAAEAKRLADDAGTLRKKTLEAVPRPPET